MFSKFLASTTLVLALLSQVNAHAAIAPQLGVGASPKRSDVKRPSTANPCGAGATVAASALDSSTAVAAGADGSVKATVTNFNAGKDGSRQVTAKVDPTGAGKNFVAMTVTTNGNGNPTNVGSEPIVAQLPAGTKCTGGTSGNLCLVQFTTTAGFGDCVVVSQGAASAGAASTAGAAAGGAAAGAVVGGVAASAKKGSGAATAGAVAAAAKGANAAGNNAATAGTAAADTATAGTAAAGSGTATTATSATADAGTTQAGKKHHHKGAKKASATAQAGTRAARALRAEIEGREAEVVQLVKRAYASWARS